MNIDEKYSALHNILTALRQKENMAQLRGEKETATALSQTAQKLEHYIADKQKQHSKMF